MVYLVLEKASTTEADCFDKNAYADDWRSVASTQANTEQAAKSLMLDNILEMSNRGELHTNNYWLRLVYYLDDHVTVDKVEVF